MSPVTVCLASCNRFDLLQKTLDSFFSLNTYPITKFLITEDSTVIEMKDKILSKYGNKIELDFNPVNLGPFRTFDALYTKANTEYIFHCEDDWLFKGNPNFLGDSIAILEERKDIHQIWIRHDIDQSWLEQEIIFTEKNIPFRKVRLNHLGEWSGFSGNPSLRRKSDYLTMFPNGYSQFIIPNTFGGLTELACNNHAKAQGYRAASLIHPSIRHLGHGRSTIK